MAAPRRAADRERHGSGMKRHRPSQEQSGKAGHATTSGPARKWANSPVPPENVTTPERVEIEDDISERTLPAGPARVAGRGAAPGQGRAGGARRDHGLPRRPEATRAA